MDALNFNLDCGCVLPHDYRPAIINGEDLNGLTCIMPAGVKAVYLGQDESFRKNLSKLYRLDSPLNDLSICAESLSGRDFAAIAELITLPEDGRLIVSDGELAALGKFLSRRQGVKHIVRGEIACGHDFVFDRTYRVEKLSPTAAVVIDKIISGKAVNIPKAFAFVMSCFFALFDWDVTVLLRGTEACSNIFARAKNITNALIKAAKTYSKRSNELRLAAHEAAVAMSALVDITGGRLLMSGATQTAAAISMLFKHEERELLDIYDTAFLLSPLVARSYAAFLDTDIPFCRPPDIALRAASLTEYLGLSERQAYSLMPPYLSGNAIKLADYRLNVYRDQLLRQIYAVISLLDEGRSAYFKLYEDDGFALKDYITCLDSSLALGLAADILRGDTLLSFMRGKGLLDRFIL